MSKAFKTWDEFKEHLNELQSQKNPLREIKWFISRRRYKIDTFYYELKAAYHRARYGWSRWDFLIMGYDSRGMKWLGEAMIQLGKEAHGAPQSYVDKYGDPDGFHQWANDLASYGCDLINGYSDVGQDMPDNMTTSERNAWFEGYSKITKAREERATAALHWVADNWQSLWD